MATNREGVAVSRAIRSSYVIKLHNHYLVRASGTHSREWTTNIGEATLYGEETARGIAAALGAHCEAAAVRVLVTVEEATQ